MAPFEMDKTAPALHPSVKASSVRPKAASVSASIHQTIIYEFSANF
jgi:hypothetical protein